ncbi:alpha/beta hydrolase family protein [Quadrisphaera sp. KR29]|uniref:alpha/beta hydrolase family protein n=1 Tax=Quadrisphaera sp. KR29 TaxID=3461391 RepID=UPI00404448C9
MAGSPAQEHLGASPRRRPGRASAAAPGAGLPEPAEVVRLGEHPSQVCDLHLPAGGAATRVAALVHGGFWRAGYDRSLEDAVAADLLARGWAVWNVDYRAVGDGGGWPGTLDDVAAGLDALPGVLARHGLGGAPVALVGHSAGGHLVAWAGTRRGPGDAGALRPAAVVAQAGVVDLLLSERLRLGDGAATALLGGPSAALPERWAAADPARRVPLGRPLLAVVGDADDVVPPALSASLVEAARAAGDDAQLVVVPGEGHMEHLDPASAVWREALSWLERVLPAAAQRAR